jgi:hypothetical protein
MLVSYRIPQHLAIALWLLSAPGPAAPLPDSVISCVPCHDRSSRDPVAEWLASPYSEAEGGRGCTDCHVRLCAGNGQKSAGGTVTPERFPGEVVRLALNATCTGDAVDTEVAVSNLGVGHRLPTGVGLRTLVLEVVARDGNDLLLPLRSGQVNGSMTARPRLLPFATDVTRYRFASPQNGPARVSARLVLKSATAAPMEIARTSAVCRPSGEMP